MEDNIRKEDRLRVAAYCRVSTELEEQEGSFETQVRHYREKIGQSLDMELVGIYGDRGKSGLKASRRPELQRLLRNCRAGKIEILLPTWIQSHDSFENEPPFEYPLNPLFSNRYQHRKRSEPLTFISCPEHFLC